MTTREIIGALFGLGVAVYVFFNYDSIMGVLQSFFLDVIDDLFGRLFGDSPSPGGETFEPSLSPTIEP